MLADCSPPTAQEVAIAFDSLGDIARALLLTGFKRMPPKLLTLTRHELDNGMRAYDLSILAITHREPGMVLERPGEAAAQLARQMLKTYPILLACVAHSSSYTTQGHILELSLYSRDQLVQRTYSIDPQNFRLTLL